MGFVGGAETDALLDDAAGFAAAAFAWLATGAEATGDGGLAATDTALATGAALAAIFDADIEAGDAEQARRATIDAIAGLADLAGS